MNKIALFGVLAFSALMVGCSSTQTCDTDNKMCNTAQCADGADCDPSNCDKADCKKGAKVCTDGAQDCKDGCSKPCCESKGDKKCDGDCTKACCDKEGEQASACTHPNTTFECAKCTEGSPCCAGCAAKAAAGCPDCSHA